MENAGVRPTSTSRFFDNEMSDLRNLMPEIFFLGVGVDQIHAQKKYFGHQISQIRYLAVKKSWSWGWSYTSIFHWKPMSSMTIMPSTLQFLYRFWDPNHNMTEIMICAGLAILEVIVITKKHSRMFIIDLYDYTMRLMRNSEHFSAFGQQALNTLPLARSAIALWRAAQ